MTTAAFRNHHHTVGTWHLYGRCFVQGQLVLHWPLLISFQQLMPADYLLTPTKYGFKDFNYNCDCDCDSDDDGDDYCDDDDDYYFIISLDAIVVVAFIAEIHLKRRKIEKMRSFVCPLVRPSVCLTVSAKKVK